MIYQDIMNKVPSYWTPMSTDVKYCTVELCDPNTPEFIEIDSRLRGNYFQATNGIYRVQNPLLWTKFLFKKEEYSKRGPTEIKTLYHDTSVVNVESLCQFNFDWRMGERFMFGPGVYFSIKPDIAFKHSSKNHVRQRAMFIVDVLVQNIQKSSDENIVLPDFGYDTVLAHADQTYVKYFDSEFYPRYFMIYEPKNSYRNLQDNIVSPLSRYLFR